MPLCNVMSIIVSSVNCDVFVLFMINTDGFSLRTTTSIHLLFSTELHYFIA